jgi:pimeloyl-ACP methyl ester carboxylesterase
MARGALIMVRPLVTVGLCTLVALVLSGCLFRDAFRQIAQLDTPCMISGTLVDGQDKSGPYVVVVLDAKHEDVSTRTRVADFFVMENPGAWVFRLQPGDYRLIAFRDQRGDLELGPGDPQIHYPTGRALPCDTGQHQEHIELALTDDSVSAGSLSLALTRKRGGFLGETARSMISLGQATAFGEVTTLDHARFAMENATDSLWRPVDFYRNGHAGIYFLAPYDERKTPVLFVHGINGSPRVFTDMIAALDTARFQAWVYYYPSGIGLDENSRYLTTIMQELELRYALKDFHIVAHSMGGLVARDFLLRRKPLNPTASVPLFIPLSAPWGGHGAAGRAVDSSPLVMPVWTDMAPNSDYLARLFSQAEHPVPLDTEKHLMFSYRGGDQLTWGTTDGVITLASLLRAEAQDQAATVYGFDTTHIGILSDPVAIERVQQILAGRWP